jgi:hypothetical protein
MRLLAKDYFTLGELVDEWCLPEADILYLAENGQLRLAVRVFGLVVENGDIEVTDDGHWFRIPHEQPRYSGLLDLTERDAHTVLKAGSAVIGHFHVDNPGYCVVVDPSDAMLVSRHDLLVRRNQKDQVEALIQGRAVTSHAIEAPKTGGLVHSEDYREVKLGALSFRLGAIQSDIVRRLHQAAKDGHPWRSGKLLLTEAGAASLRMSDLFKSKPSWRRLVLSDGRGMYRIATGDDEGRESRRAGGGATRRK